MGRRVRSICSTAILALMTLTSLGARAIAQPIIPMRGPDVVWETASPMPTARQGLGVAIAADGMLYAVGGTTLPLRDPDTYAINVLEAYDPARDMWTTRAPMPTPREDLALVAGPAGKLYAIGGAGIGTTFHGLAPDVVLATVEEYDPATDSWASLPPMPTPRARPAAAVGSDGSIYVVGGTVAGQRLANLERYDPETATWQSLRPMATPRWWLGLAAAPNGKLYAIGGLGNPGGGEVEQDASLPYGISLVNDPVATVEEYDPATDSWTTRASLSKPRWHFDAVAAPDGRIYAVGGHEASAPVATVEAYDAATDSWTLLPPMPTARFGLGVAVTADGWLCAIGGTPPTLATVERARIVQTFGARRDQQVD